LYGAVRGGHDVAATYDAAIADTSFAPITVEYELGCDAGSAFGVYTGRIGDWWDARYTARPDTLKGVTIEPRIGGRVFATHGDLGEHDWGEVTVWEPGRRLVHTFTLAQDVRHPSEVAVEFVPGEDGSKLRFAHGGWTEANVAARAKFGDWTVILDRFVRLAGSGA
jgi:hypothetical protein